MRYSVCVASMFSGNDLYDGLQMISRLGIDTFEFWDGDSDLSIYQKARRELGMNVAGFCAKTISLTDPAKRSEYVEGLRDTIKKAQSLGAENLICLVGSELSGVSRTEQYQSIVDGIRACLPLLEQAGIVLLIEPLNTRIDHPGYYLSSSDEAFAIHDEINSPYVKVLFDIYHQQITEGHLIARITANIEKIGHIHVAGNPGRNEPDSGEINYREIFKAIKKTGYSGYIGLEYFPLRDPREGLQTLLAWQKEDE